MVNSRIWTRYLRLERQWHPTHVLNKTPVTLRTLVNSARHGQFHDKEKNADYWIKYFRFEKKISTESNDTSQNGWIH